MSREVYDLVVVGAGSGGYAAARTARDCGASVALVDQGPLGGLCILRGCMPSKAFLASSDAAHDAREARRLGVNAGEISIDMPFIAARKRGLVQSFAEYRIEGIKSFPLYEGKARFVTPHQLVVTPCRSDSSPCHPEPFDSASFGGDAQEKLDERSSCHPERSERSERSRGTGDSVILEARNFIIATGSVTAPALVPGLAQTGYLDSDAVLELERIPKSAIVLGGGYTACELGQFLARMGSRTTIVIRSGQLLTYADEDVGTALTDAFVEEGIEIVKHATLLSVSRRGGKKVVRFSAPEPGGDASCHPERSRGSEAEIAAEEIFFALGRVPDVDGLGLDAVGVRYDRVGGITVDASLRTNVPNIFAIGDVTGEFLLVHVAIYQGEVAARNAVLGTSELADYRVVSAHTIFSDPQVAHVGESEKSLKASGAHYVTGRYDFAEHGKALCLGKTQGFVKMMADMHSGEILGATVIGPQASELIHEVIVGMHYRATVQDFMRIPHLHPTLAEIWTYPAEECAARLGMKAPGDEQMEVATSGTSS